MRTTGSVMQTILWRRLDRPGHEAACLSFQGQVWQLLGTVVTTAAGRPCRLDYAVVCDTDWRTRWARVSGWYGFQPLSCRIARDPAGIWRVNGQPRPELAGCDDVDLDFSPITSLLPIRRLRLPVGEEARVRAAWLRIPSLSVDPLDQVYQRIEDRRWFHALADGMFNAILDVDDMGLVQRYGQQWEAVARFPETLMAQAATPAPGATAPGLTGSSAPPPRD